MTARGQGTIDNPDGSATFHLRSVQVGQDSYGNLALDASLGDQRARLRAIADKFNVTASADLSTQAPYAGKAEIAIDDLDLASLPMKSDAGVSGTLRAHLNAAGNLTESADGFASATIDRLEMTWNNQPFSVDGPATIRYHESGGPD